MKTAVCIATYNRPLMLVSLLRSLDRLVLAPADQDLVLVIVDNDARGSAATAIERARATTRWPIVAGMQPERNIALARNRSIDLALDAGADAIAFVDDDEEVAADWLAELLRVRSESGADIVAGPVRNGYPAEVPAWIRDSGLPDRRQAVRPHAPLLADTSNSLVMRRVFDLVPEGFDPRFGLSGGSDSVFFTRAAQAGARTAWAANAWVAETLPETRATTRWILRRGFRSGNAEVFVSRATKPVTQWLPRRLGSAAYRIGRGTVMLVPAAFKGRAALTRSARDVAVGLGTIAGLLGYRYIEYVESHGS